MKHNYEKKLLLTEQLFEGFDNHIVTILQEVQSKEVIVNY